MQRVLALLGFLIALTLPARAAEPVIPDFWDARERLPKPDLGEIQRLRFLTTIDFPPFNYLDREGRLSGFHIDLARALCARLELESVCQIQALPWDELQAALARGDGEAIIAGIAVTAESRGTFAFSRPYLRLPARFVMRGAEAAEEPLDSALAGHRVGVMAGSAHERALRALFPAIHPVTYSRESWMLDDLRQGKTDAAFGDGMRLSFWLAGEASEDCCRFAGGPYLLPEYLGRGLAIAARPRDTDLVDAFDHALQAISVDGTFAELYLRHFPISFF